MDIKYASNEQLVKTWDYASSKEGSDRRDYNISVTNKRIIYTAEGNKGIDRREMYLSDVKTLEYGFAKSAGIGTILLLIFGIITAIVVVGIFMIIKAVHLLREKTFTLEITANGFESEGISVGASSLLTSKKHKKLKVKVYKEAAMELINELGAIVASAK